jgi:hypothetical protein
MTLSTVLFALGLAAAVILVLSYILMMANVLLSRLYFFRYLGAYREATVKETGRTGPLIRVCISSVVLAFLFVVAGFLAPRG